MEYFTENEIYVSFSQLNLRLKLLPNLILITEEDADPMIYSFFESFKSIQLDAHQLSEDIYWCNEPADFRKSMFF